MLQILTGSKNLNHWVLGAASLNNAGLHRARVQLADRCNQRRKRAAVTALGDEGELLSEQGYLALENFLPDDQFAMLLAEADKAVASANADAPAQVGEGRQFGAKKAHPWGFDRHDGGTLNRFLEINPTLHPCASEFSRHERLSALSEAISGGRQKSKYVWFYLTLHGDQERASDPQKAFHRDTFFSSLKFWYFLKPVSEQEGPFEYVPGSHKLTAERLDWEHEKAMVAIAKPRGKRSSSFRISEAELSDMNLPGPVAMTVPGNTLVIADTFGFHRRGLANAGASRLALYGNMRPWPFSPVVL